MPGEAISILQRGNLQSLERTLRKQWRLGQNIVLCWCWDERGLLVIFVPHYFLGNFCAAGSEGQADDNERYIRALIAGKRRKRRDDLFAIAARLGAAPTFIKLDHPLDETLAVVAAVEEIIRRYGLSFVERRAVLLFDITDFSLCSPFEQASQLNSLSYSMNSAYNKLAARGITISFARTTTGDGYYVWNRDSHRHADRDLFLFLLLVLADNAMARAASRGNTVPVIRTAFSIGSHYELYQAEGVNPTVFSYIVGEITIELARIIDKALPGQVLIGDFKADSGSGPGSEVFVAAANEAADKLHGLLLMGSPLTQIRTLLTRETTPDTPLLNIRITDKHGFEHLAHNLEATLSFGERELHLGLTEAALREMLAEAPLPEGGLSLG